MLRLQNLEEIEKLLLKIPGIILQLEENDPSFISSARLWLLAAEQTFSNNRLSVSSEIAVIRGAVIAAERGLDVVGPTKRGTTRRYRDAAVANLLRQATEVVANAIRPRRFQVDEAQKIMMQVVAVAHRLNLIVPNGSENRTRYLQSIRQAISDRPELANHLVHITGTLGNTDTLVMLDCVIEIIQQ